MTKNTVKRRRHVYIFFLLHPYSFRNFTTRQILASKRVFRVIEKVLSGKEEEALK